MIRPKQQQNILKNSLVAYDEKIKNKVMNVYNLDMQLWLYKPECDILKDINIGIT